MFAVDAQLDASTLRNSISHIIARLRFSVLTGSLALHVHLHGNGFKRLIKQSNVIKEVRDDSVFTSNSLR